LKPESRKSPNKKSLQGKKDRAPDPKDSPTLEAPANKSSKSNFPIVAVGASAGGLEAFTKLLNNIPEDSGFAFVLIQHLDPSHPSSLPELLSRQTAIPVLEATNGLIVKPDHIYVIPAGTSMSISNRALNLIKQPIPGLGHNIDIFFKSMAEDLGEQAIGIILSGTGTDGVEGAIAIKSRSGMVIVQEPDSAKYEGMPQAAIAAGVQDRVLPPETMALHILKHVQHVDILPGLVEELKESDIGNIKRILSFVKAQTRHDFSGYKAASISRRIRRRLNLNQITNLDNYFNFLKSHPVEIEALVKEFLINVTSFFRDVRAFESFQKQIQQLVKNKEEGSEVRVWVPGCASGEEAYSIAIILMECIKDIKKNLQIQVFGTDLDSEAIAFARVGNYPLSISKDVGPERLKQFFKKYDNSYKTTKELRDRLVFAVQDLILDPPYSRMDIISLRNVLIYLDSEVQKKVISNLHYALNKDGLLFLGTAETIGESTDLFAVIDRKWRIYRCINKDIAPLPHTLNTLTGWELKPVKQPDSGPDQRVPVLPEHLLLEALPPSVLIDQDYQVTFTHGNTGKYLQLPEGKPTNSILQMVNPRLRTALATALREASETKMLVVRLVSVSKEDEDGFSVKIEVLPISKPSGTFVITFQDMPRPKKDPKNHAVEFGANNHDLELELRDTRETLRSTVEELETSNEELKTSNEEFQSTNEELQSANEELESSREELQSTNEELETINSEHQKKIEQLDMVNDDMNNLLNSTNVATLFLDEDLKILRFTPAMTSLFNFVETDKGRSIAHITSHLKIISLVQLAHKVLENLIPVEQTVETDNGKWFSMRIYPYRTTDNTIAGVVVSFIDINKERKALTYAQSIIDTIRESIMVLDERLKVVSVNKSFCKTFHVTRKNTEGQLIYKLGKGQWDVPELRKLLENILSKNEIFNDYKVEYRFPNIGPRVMLLNARRIHDELGSNQRILLAMEDITTRSKPAVKTTHKSDPGSKEKK
jgi:two-component system, chemotaxis family, CheB/CheR fusion protein